MNGGGQVRGGMVRCAQQAAMIRARRVPFVLSAESCRFQEAGILRWIEVRI